MNFHSPQPWQPWRNTEEATLIAMRAAGHSNRDIANLLGRTYRSVRSRAVALRVHPKPKLAHQVREPNLSQFIEIEHLPDWYAIGWRVQSFDKHSCLLEWPHECEPRWPANRTGTV